MNKPVVIGDGQHDSCHHVDTSLGDSFGGMGTTREYRDEEITRGRLLATCFDLVVLGSAMFDGL